MLTDDLQRTLLSADFNSILYSYLAKGVCALDSKTFWGAGYKGHAIYVTIFAILVLKVAILLYWGPGMAPDSWGYLQFANRILQDQSWLFDAELENSAMPVSAFRMFGYPLLIAGAKLVSLEFWQWIVVIVQLSVSVSSLIYVSRLSRQLGINPILGAFCLLATSTSFSLTLDQMILTDSIVASIVIIILCEISVGGLRKNPFTLSEGLFLGALLAVAFLFREGVFILSVLFAVPMIVRVYLAESGKSTSCCAVLVFFVPLLFASQFVLHWNEARSGLRFLTTGGQTVYLQGLMDAAAHDVRIFSGERPLELIAQEQFEQFVFSEVLTIQGEMFEEGYTAPEIATIAKDKYFESWIDYPLTMLSTTIRHFRGRFPSLNFRPIASLRETGLWVTHEYPWSSYGDLRAQAFTEIDAFVLFAVESLERVIGITIWVFFVFAPCVWLARLVLGKKQSKEKALTCTALWTVYMGLMAAHLLVHIESRYFAPVIPFSILIGLLGIQKLLSRYFPKKISAHA